MKNILIMGVGRAGKSTLSEIIKSRFPEFNLIHSDSIKWGIIRAEGKEEYYLKNVEEQKQWEHSESFQRLLLETFNVCLEDDIHSHGYILESGQLEPKYVKEIVNEKDTVIVCLGHGEITAEGIFKLCRKNDTKEDWSYDETDSNLKIHAIKWSEMNKNLQEECLKYGIKYIDTSKNRDKILQNVLEEIIIEIKK